MRKSVYAAAFAAMFLFVTTVSFAEEAAKAAPTMIGLKKCAMCHKGEAKGKIYESWMETGHAKAYSLLANEKSAEVMKKLNRTGSAQDDKECLSCHVTNMTLKDEGVSCESCHGAGSDYSPMKVMKDHAASVAAGMVEKPKEGCVKCHNEKSPTYKEFKLDEAWAKVAHGKAK
ncbi:MAG: cytochrome c family protein [bacterium]|nr:cytochrome c family protein [bacterium]